MTDDCTMLSYCTTATAATVILDRRCDEAPAEFLSLHNSLIDWEIVHRSYLDGCVVYVLRNARAATEVHTDLAFDAAD